LIFYTIHVRLIYTTVLLSILSRILLPMKYSLTILVILFFAGLSAAQTTEREIDRPKLVVGIIVDQMRQEYLYRFYNKFGNAGFKRMMNDGFMLRNAHYNYVPTVTGPGHASVYTGTTPAYHGIISNEWYDKTLQKEVNCVNDPQHKPVGSTQGNGDVSPWRLLTTTITDELKLFSQKKSKVIGVSVKDRGAVLPAGHMADAAYWYDGTTGNFITSTYYMTRLPEWMEKFNARKLPDQYLAQEWKTVYPIDQYTESGPDDTPYENKIAGKERTTFPYNLKALRKDNDFDLLTSFPFVNDYLTEMAKAAIEGEKLGQSQITDFLAISFSQPDILGHAVGPNAIEVEDSYIRLDRNIEDLLKTLDTKIGTGKYTVFLTSDHAVSDVTQYLKDNRIPSGNFKTSRLKDDLNNFLKKYFPDKEVVEAVDGDQVFFDQEVFQSDPKASGVELLVATELVMNYLMAQEGIANVYSENILRQGRYDEQGVKGMVIRGYHPKRSGDVVFVLEPGWYNSERATGTTHGSPYSYDTNVPVLFFGQGVSKGSSVKYHPITDIAPTVSVLMRIKFPSGATGQPIEEMLK
jgi:predicted AlkP superfamily pyrophosphatase or phosphodiesterase